MIRPFLCRIALAGLGVLNSLPAGAADGTTPRLAVSIAPLHSIVSTIADGVTEPRLLLPPGASPHSYALRPSDARAIRHADLVVWIGPALESFLERPLTILAGTDRLLTVTNVDGIALLPARGDTPQSHGGDRHADDRHDDSAGRRRNVMVEGIDPHVWLSSANARAIARAVAARLVRDDPAHRNAYRANLTRALAGIDRTARDIEVLVGPVRHKPFMTFHDAFQYFERDFGLNSAGWIAIDAARRPSARRLSALRQQLKESGARCLFAEPQFPPALLKTVAEGTDVTIAGLDPVGARIGPGPDHWNRLMMAIARSLRDCLQEH